jgi:hypothetical protein
MQMSWRVVASGFLLGALSCQGAKGEMQTALEVLNGRATVRGIVRENNKACELDGPCYLALSTDSAPIWLYYHHGEYPPCANESSIRTGLSVREGDHVEASGSYSVANQVHVVDVCCADCSLTVMSPR